MAVTTPVSPTSPHPVEQSEEVIQTSLTGSMLLEHPLLNKGSAFPENERSDFGLLGLLPSHIATMDEQLARTYENYCRKDTDLERYIFLASLQDRNETLFYRLLQEHIREMSPIIYTPEVGEACEHYSHIYRRPRGVYVSYRNRDQIDAMLRDVVSPDVRVIVVTDGERILGLGDLGIGGMGIPVGKLALYTLCAGVHPAQTLPIVLDVGTDNPALLDDPLYLGLHQHRVRGAAYDEFIDTFVQSVKRTFPTALLQWEDFAKDNARRLLDRYRDQICSFNDDIQGTGAVTLAGLLAAVRVTGSTLKDQRVVVLGAGSAATGICEQIVAAMVSEGSSHAEALASISLVDRHGLVYAGRAGIDATKQVYARPLDVALAARLMSSGTLTLADVVAAVHPTILIGTAAQPGAFTEAIVRDMASHVERPIIFPLSNPTSKSEAVPSDLIAWTGGRAIVATGSPFPDVQYEGRSISVGQCNNMFIFPGVGLGVIAVKAHRVTDGMFVAAARALSECSPARHDPAASLYPPVEDVRDVSYRVALAVSAAAQRADVAEAISDEELERRVRKAMWTPEYRPLRRAASAAETGSHGGVMPLPGRILRNLFKHQED
ncbi:MAG TPA: NAD-dependent malic enzyme [Ktedonobacterales bacterium]